MRYALFSGCMIPAKYPGFEKATRLVAERLGVELVDLPFSCCPAPTLIKLVHYNSWLALAARNLCVAEQEGVDILSLCNGCTNTLKEANHVLQKDSGLRKKVNQVLGLHGKEFKGEVKVKPLLDVLCEDVGAEAVASRVTERLGFRVGCHYGCHFFRPPHVMYPDRLSPSLSLVPTQMDEILHALGIETVQYSRRLLCCGSALGTKVDLDAANQITREKLSHMRDKEVETICVSCPSCFEQFDRGQVLLNRKDGELPLMPVFHIAQVLGLAFGLDRKLLGFEQHRVKVEPLLGG
jgi:heterodisulfide reductase subunit B2